MVDRHRTELKFGQRLLHEIVLQIKTRTVIQKRLIAGQDQNLCRGAGFRTLPQPARELFKSADFRHDFRRVEPAAAEIHPPEIVVIHQTLGEFAPQQITGFGPVGGAGAFLSEMSAQIQFIQKEFSSGNRLGANLFPAGFPDPSAVIAGGRTEEIDPGRIQNFLISAVTGVGRPGKRQIISIETASRSAVDFFGRPTEKFKRFRVFLTEKTVVIDADAGRRGDAEKLSGIPGRSLPEGWGRRFKILPGQIRKLPDFTQMFQRSIPFEPPVEKRLSMGDPEVSRPHDRLIESAP